MAGKQLNSHSLPILLFVLAVTLTVIMWMAAPRMTTTYDSMVHPALQVYDGGSLKASVKPSRLPFTETPGVINDITANPDGLLPAEQAGNSIVLQLALSQAIDR